MCMSGAHRARKGFWIPGRGDIAMWPLETKAGSYKRAASVLNFRVITSTPRHAFCLINWSCKQNKCSSFSVIYQPSSNFLFFRTTNGYNSTECILSSPVTVSCGKWNESPGLIKYDRGGQISHNALGVSLIVLLGLISVSHIAAPTLEYIIKSCQCPHISNIDTNR